MKSIKHYMQFYTDAEIQFAHEIAERLQDPAALNQFLRYTKEVPHTVLRACLEKACATPDHKIDKSRASIFVSSVKPYLQHGNGYSRN
jgi:hypothetical protein